MTTAAPGNEMALISEIVEWLRRERESSQMTRMEAFAVREIITALESGSWRTEGVWTE